MLAERALADVVREPTNTSCIRLAPTPPMYRWGTPRLRTSTPSRLRSVLAATSEGSEKVRLIIYGEAYPCGITLLAATTLAQELIEGVGEDDNYRLFVKVRKVRSAASIRSRDLGTRLRVPPVLLAVRQLSPAGLHSPWLDAVCQYTLSRFGPQRRPPFLPNDPALPAFLPACGDQLQQDLSDGAGWFLPQ